MDFLSLAVLRSIGAQDVATLLLRYLYYIHFLLLLSELHNKKLLAKTWPADILLYSFSHFFKIFEKENDTRYKNRLNKCLNQLHKNIIAANCSGICGEELLTAPFVAFINPLFGRRSNLSEYPPPLLLIEVLHAPNSSFLNLLVYWFLNIIL